MPQEEVNFKLNQIQSEITKPTGYQFYCFQNYNRSKVNRGILKRQDVPIQPMRHH